jgi:hypothetical protein
LAAALPLVESVDSEGNACTDELRWITSAALLLASQIRSIQRQHDAVPGFDVAAMLRPVGRLLHIVALRGLGTLVPTLPLANPSDAAADSEGDVSTGTTFVSKCTREVALAARASAPRDGAIGSLLTECLARAAGH